MKNLIILSCLLLFATSAGAAGRAVDYEMAGQSFEGYYVSPSPRAPLVFLIHDWDGLGSYEIKRSEMLSEMGYAVFAADLFGKGIRPAEIAERRRLTEALYKDRARLRASLKASLEAARSQGADIGNAVAAGYCFGGAAVLELARAGADLKGFVSFHGGLETPPGQDYSKVEGRILVLHGTADSSVTMEDFAALAKNLEKAGVPHEMITYGGAPHAFTVLGGDRYRKDADEKSWRRFGFFLKETLK
ncbi:MAG: dienelactone hydrolase family protein [Syntrophotaleaceae bacterium]